MKLFELLIGTIGVVVMASFMLRRHSKDANDIAEAVEAVSRPGLNIWTVAAMLFVAVVICAALFKTPL